MNYWNNWLRWSNNWGVLYTEADSHSNEEVIARVQDDFGR